jgi:LysM repeat protein
MLDDKVLSTGQLSVLDAAGTTLLSPASDSVFRYYGGLPQIRFHWMETPGASHYNVEISDTPDFKRHTIKRHVSATSLVSSHLGDGTWYWRVQPVFPSIHHGDAGFSDTGVFRIEQTRDRQAPSLSIEVSETAIAERKAPAIKPEPVAITPPSLVSALAQAHTPIPTLSKSRPSAIKTYIVKPGDTLSKISFKEYGDYSMYTRIQEANNIINPDMIYIDQTLIIP